jgi:hypothetical protein
MRGHPRRPIASAILPQERSSRARFRPAAEDRLYLRIVTEQFDKAASCSGPPRLRFHASLDRGLPFGTAAGRCLARASIARMAPRFDQPIEPMTLDNMRELGVRSLAVRAARARRDQSQLPKPRLAIIPKIAKPPAAQRETTCRSELSGRNAVLITTRAKIIRCNPLRSVK